MPFAIALILIVIGSVLFHLFSPWQATPPASNWGSIDTALQLTAVITGVFFIAIGLFMAIAIIRYRNRAGRKAAYEPENRRLEWWLIGITSVGIVAMLAPGLVVYDDFIHVPKNAHTVEVIGQQWNWAFRFPGNDGELGRSDVRWVSGGNPLGVDPDDPQGQDDRLVRASELHLPLNRPVRVLMRSMDVLHNFYVPQVRAKMDMVPGMITYFWFTPTVAGNYEILCAEFCGVGHYNMRGTLVIESAERFDHWLSTQATFAETQVVSATPDGGDPLVAAGRQVAETRGCLACHSVDGGPSAGPGWMNLHGRKEALTDDSEVLVTDAYLEESIREPNAKVVKGFHPIMPPYSLEEDQMQALLAYIRSLSEISTAPVQEQGAFR